MKTTTNGRRNISIRNDLISALTMILGANLEGAIRQVAQGMSDASLREWIETEMQFRQAA